MNNKVDFLPINIAIVTISDTRDLENDKSGDVLAHRIEHSGHNIVAREIVKDDFHSSSPLFLVLAVVLWDHSASRFSLAKVFNSSPELP